MIGHFLNIIGDKLNDFYFKYENIILIGDFNSEMREDAMNTFCITYNLANLPVLKTLIMGLWCSG